MESIQFGKKSEFTKITYQLLLCLTFVFIFLSIRFFTIKTHHYYIYKSFSVICLLLSLFFFIFFLKTFIFFKKYCQFELTCKGIILNGPFIKSKIIYWEDINYFKEISINKGTMPTIAIYLKNPENYIQTLNFINRLFFKYNKNRNYGDINFISILMDNKYDEILSYLTKHIRYF